MSDDPKPDYYDFQGVLACPHCHRKLVKFTLDIPWPIPRELAEKLIVLCEGCAHLLCFDDCAQMRVAPPSKLENLPIELRNLIRGEQVRTWFRLGRKGA
jgi:hypothetical protein